MIVGGTKDLQVKASGHALHILAGRLVVVTVIALDTEETDLSHGFDDLFRKEALAGACPGVGQHRDSSGVPDQPHGFDRIGSPVVHVVRERRVQCLHESFVPVAEGSSVDQGVRDVRSADGAALGSTGLNVLPGDREVGGEVLDHSPSTGGPGLDGLREGPVNAFCSGVQQVSKQVDSDPIGSTGHLDASQQSDAGLWYRRRCLLPAGEGVVIRQAHHVESRITGSTHEFGRCIRAVRARAVGVGINEHASRVVDPLGTPPRSPGPHKVCIRPRFGHLPLVGKNVAMTSDQTTPPSSTTTDQPLEDRNENRSHRPESDAFRAFMGANWGPRPDTTPHRADVADHLPARAAAAGRPFAGERLVIPAGTYKVRSNDTDYRFRAHSAFAHLSGLGGEKEPDAVLVLEPGEVDEAGAAVSPHEAVLYFKPRSSRSSREFYADSRYGEFWVGARPSLEEVSALLGLRCEHIDNLRDALSKDAGQVRLRIVREVDAKVQAMVDEVRSQAGLPAGEDAREDDEAFEEHLSEIRLCKDEWEIAELQRAVDVTKLGFEDIIRSLPRAVGHRRGERVVEGAFGAVAREEGNGLGYDTIAACGNHANTLHWIDNDGAVRAGELILVDAGVEVDSLYTADITRTLPVDGHFTEAQAKVYQAVLDACEASLARANQPGARFRDLHAAAMEVIVDRLDAWGLLPVSKEEALSADGQQHRRWMPHGTSHHLGLDVHDCAQARREMYQDALLEPGMCFTIEPGLYFRADDDLLPEELRGIGVRIEDDVVVNADGSVTRLSESIPRTIDEVEKWMAQLQGR